MIQIQELRVGNLFNDKDGTSCYFAGCWQRLDGWIVRDSGSNTYKERDIHGIPLSDEVLVKCGFKHGMVEGITSIRDEGEPEIPGDTHYWDLRIPRNNIVEDLPTFSIVKFGDGGYKFSHQWLRVEIKYLHTLQNLFYAFCGEELNYTP